MSQPSIDRNVWSPRRLYRINKNNHGYSSVTPSFSKCEPEVVAEEVFRFCKKRNSWADFTDADVKTFGHEEWVAGWLPQLVKAGLLEYKDGTYHITDLFIAMCLNHVSMWLEEKDKKLACEVEKALSPIIPKDKGVKVWEEVRHKVHDGAPKDSPIEFFPGSPFVIVNDPSALASLFKS